MKGFNRLQVAGIIPARYASTRFPGKPLAMLGNRPMIQMVYEQTLKSLENVFVATDDERIRKAVLNFGGKVIMTSAEHNSGTDRCSEALTKIREEAGFKIDIVVNIQGDEPFIKPEQIDLLVKCFEDSSVDIATLIRKAAPGEDIFNSGEVKVVTALNSDALYFSRAAIPFIRDSEMKDWSYKHCYYNHVGIYAYRAETLVQITSLPRSTLEIAESLEQNRWLENGFRIRTAVTDWESFGIDSPEDLAKARALINDIG
jgi:3-deoxy-manno-octulosonate cytidylyltransferase (CMP-KDO synthetase)